MTDSTRLAFTSSWRDEGKPSQNYEDLIASFRYKTAEDINRIACYIVGYTCNDVPRNVFKQALKGAMNSIERR